MANNALACWWHGLCDEGRAMKNAYRSLPKRGRLEVQLSVALLIGIITALVVPAPNRTKPQTEDGLFTLVETDYINPLFSSASVIRILNGAAKQVAQFAGYDEYSSRVDIDGTATVANVTRFSGDLLAMLNVGFISRLCAAVDEPHLYISEDFRQRFLADKEDVLGMTLRVNCFYYRIAGIVRESAGLLEATDIWIPVRSRSTLGALNSMKILGALAPDGDWNDAEARIQAAFKSCGIEQVCSEAISARLLPLAKRVRFHPGGTVAATRTREATSLQAYHQPAALPFTRGS